MSGSSWQGQIKHVMIVDFFILFSSQDSSQCIGFFGAKTNKIYLIVTLHAIQANSMGGGGVKNGRGASVCK